MMQVLAGWINPLLLWAAVNNVKYGAPFSILKMSGLYSGCLFCENINLLTQCESMYVKLVATMSK